MIKLIKNIVLISVIAISSLHPMAMANENKGLATEYNNSYQTPAKLSYAVKRAFSHGTNGNKYHNAVRLLSYELGRSYQDYELNREMILVVWLNRLVQARKDYLALHKRTGNKKYLRQANNSHSLIHKVARGWNPGDARNWNQIQYRARHRWIKNYQPIKETVNNILEGKFSNAAIELVYKYGVREYSHPSALTQKIDGYPLYYLGYKAWRNKLYAKSSEYFVRGTLTEEINGKHLDIVFAIPSKLFDKKQWGELHVGKSNNGVLSHKIYWQGKKLSLKNRSYII